MSASYFVTEDYAFTMHFENGWGVRVLVGGESDTGSMQLIRNGVFIHDPISVTPKELARRLKLIQGYQSTRVVWTEDDRDTVYRLRKMKHGNRYIADVMSARYGFEVTRSQVNSIYDRELVRRGERPDPMVTFRKKEREGLGLPPAPRRKAKVDMKKYWR